MHGGEICQPMWDLLGEDVLPAWERLCDPNVRLGEKRQIREDLLAYCGQDTYGMIGLLNLVGNQCRV
jgi:hypothetical protein